MTTFIRVGIAAAAATAVALSAQAADMRPVYKAAPAPVYSWTGCYIGGQLGGQRGSWSGDVNYPAGDLLGHPAITGTHDFTGDGNLIYGGQIGCNWQLGSAFVLGVEGDVVGVNNGGDIGGEVFRFPAPFTTDHFNTTGRFGTQASLRLKGGFAIDRILLYVAGGLSWASLSATHSFIRDGDGSLVSNTSTSRNGWNIGIGADYLLGNSWTMGLEYRYTDYGSLNFNIPAGTSGGTLSWSAFTVNDGSLRTQDLRLRVNYMFNPGGAVAARY